MLDAAKRLIAPSARSEVPPFMDMDVMAAAARAALGATRLGYTETLGIPSLRARIARHYRQRHALDIDPARVVVTTGSSAGFILAFLAMFEAGDRVAVAVPGYPPYRHILKALGCEPVLLETGADTRWAITPQMLIEAHRRAPLNGVLVASPANPTGTMMSAQALADLLQAAHGEGIRFISDEIYHGLDYAFAAETAARWSDDAVVINSFSKYFCMTGWRVGWMVVPDALVRPIDRLQGNLAISVPTLSQIAAEAAFDGRAELEAVKHGYEENRRILLDGLPRIGLDRILPVDGAFYLYADVSRFSADSFAFARRMLEEVHVAVTPGLDFDPLRGHDFIRFSYAGAAADMHEAVERIGRWLGRAQDRT